MGSGKELGVGPGSLKDIHPSPSQDWGASGVTGMETPPFREHFPLNSSRISLFLSFLVISASPVHTCTYFFFAPCNQSLLQLFCVLLFFTYSFINILCCSVVFIFVILNGCIIFHPRDIYIYIYINSLTVGHRRASSLPLL